MNAAAIGDVLSAVDTLAEFIRQSQRLVVLTGAGCSTESGIPDYRSPGGVWSKHKPIYYSAFVRSADVRRFYWARSYRGWPIFDSARPNDAHRALAALEREGKVSHLITQNVDDLHQEAGSRRVIQLHGRNRLVSCISCGTEYQRVEIQQELERLNEEWLAATPRQLLRGEEADFAPDGDARIPADLIEGFRVPDCGMCGGVLKPAVVFFGESVPANRVHQAFDAVDAADALLVVGSSLTVWSGFRFAKRASERKLPIAILNLGVTRGDALASIKVEASCGVALQRALQEMGY